MLQSGRSSYRCPTISAQRHKETQSLKSPGLLPTGLLLKVSSLSKKVSKFQKQTLELNSNPKFRKKILQSLSNDMDLFGIKTTEKECSRRIPIRNVPIYRQDTGISMPTEPLCTESSNVLVGKK